MELSVVLVNHNGAACLPRTLEALARNTATEDVECIVVDSGSVDGSSGGALTLGVQSVLLGGMLVFGLHPILPAVLGVVAEKSLGLCDMT